VERRNWHCLWLLLPARMWSGCKCYRGVSEKKAIGQFDEGLQRLYMEFSKGQHESWRAVQGSLNGCNFFRPGPLMRTLECERPRVLFIDELNKVDDGFEAMLLEILSAWQLSETSIGDIRQWSNERVVSDSVYNDSPGIALFHQPV
jgi:hypothetical protein